MKISHENIRRSHIQYVNGLSIKTRARPVMKCIKSNGIAAFKRFICDLYVQWHQRWKQRGSVRRNSISLTFILIDQVYFENLEKSGTLCLCPAYLQEDEKLSTQQVDGSIWGTGREMDVQININVCAFLCNSFDAVSSIKLTFQTRIGACKLKQNYSVLSSFLSHLRGDIWEECSK